MNERISRQAWLAAAACAVMMMVSIIPILLGTFSVFLKPVSAEFAWGRAQFAGFMMVPPIIAVIMSPLVGRAADRFGVRAIVLPGVVLWGLSVMAMSLMRPNKLEMYALFLWIGFVGPLIGPVTCSKVIASWFKRRRGLVLGIVLGGAGAIGIAATIPIAAVLIAHVGWRLSYVILGFYVIALGFPVLFLFLTEPAGIARTTAKRAAAAVPAGVGARQALTLATFWLLAVAFVLNGIVVAGLRAHLVPLLTDNGTSMKLALTAISTMALAGIPGQLSAGYAVDRVQTPRIALPFFGAALIGLLLLLHTAGAFGLLAGSVILGAGFAAESAMLPYFVSRYFGLRAFGEIYGYYNGFYAIAAGFGPFVMGLCFDHFGSYTLALSIAEGMLLVSILLIAALRPYVYAVEYVETPDEVTPLEPEVLGQRG